MRLIDADALIDDLYEHEFSNWCDKDEVSTLVNDAPSIDIVRCKECKWGEVVRNHSIGFCENLCGVRSAITESSYCSYGERKESE